MKFSSIKTDQQGAKTLKQYDVADFVARIREDRNKYLISDFRANYRPSRVHLYRRYHEIPHIYAAVELCRQTNGAIGFAAYNGLVVLEVHGLMNTKDIDGVKDAAMSMAQTLAAFRGASGQEVVILVRVARSDGSLPATEAEAETFYVAAYNRMARLYDAALPAGVTRMTPSLHHAFLLPLDPTPRYNSEALPFRFDPQPGEAEVMTTEQHLLALPEERDAEEIDMTAYMNYERIYEAAAESVHAKMGSRKHRGNTYYKDFVTAMATELFASHWPEEETVCHLWRHLTFKDEPGLTEDFVRTLVSAVYTEEGSRHDESWGTKAQEALMQQVIRRIESRYVLRYNTIMGYPEYRSNHTWVTPWSPVTEKVVNTFTTDLQIAGLNVWNRDVKRYIHSTRVRDYNPIEEYLFDRRYRWDGRDHIRRLASTVPTSDAAQWAEWFHTWFLAMVAQWRGSDHRYGNAIVPLLISPQGMHKSAFCRQLLPPALRQWGYTDNLSLSDERSVHLAMAQMLLINLDEFNRISPQKQQGFLKNIVQLPSVKVKRPYAKHTEEVPRLASFIATTNIADVLADPTGSRRFVGIEVTGDIDTTETPHYEQLYAQAMAELDAGVRCWFDEEETEVIMQHNQRFQHRDSMTQFFFDFYEPAQPSEPEAEWMTPSAIIMAVKQRAGSALATPSPVTFGRTLHGIADLPSRRSKHGVQYCVKAII